jgi:hypothetical protein
MREFLLGNQWLEEAVERFNEKGWPTEQITDYVNAWSSRVVAYVLYLKEEGYSAAEIPKIVNSAIDDADFDLSQMPVVP